MVERGEVLFVYRLSSVVVAWGVGVSVCLSFVDDKGEERREMVCRC